MNIIGKKARHIKRNTSDRSHNRHPESALRFLSDLLARKKPERRFWMPIVAAVGGIPFYMAGLFADDVHQAYLLIGSGVLISSSYNGVAAAIIQYLVKPDQRALTG